MSFTRMVDRCFRSQDPLEAMLKKTAVYDGLVALPDHGEAILREAAARCLQCGQVEDCLDRLEHGACHARPPSYCCNREMIEALRKSHEARGAGHAVRYTEP